MAANSTTLNHSWIFRCNLFCLSLSTIIYYLLLCILRYMMLDVVSKFGLTQYLFSIQKTVTGLKKQVFFSFFWIRRRNEVKRLNVIMCWYWTVGSLSNSVAQCWFSYRFKIMLSLHFWFFWTVASRLSSFLLVKLDGTVFDGFLFCFILLFFCCCRVDTFESF